MAIASLSEDTRTVERDDIDTAHLLGQHDSASTVVGTSNPRNSEAVPKTSKVTSASILTKLLVVDDVRVVVIAGTDDGVSSKLGHGDEAIGDATVLHQPTGRFGAEVNADGEEEGGDEGRAEFKTPRDVADIFDDYIGAETEEDTWCCQYSNLIERK